MSLVLTTLKLGDQVALHGNLEKVGRVTAIIKRPHNIRSLMETIFNPGPGPQYRPGEICVKWPHGRTTKHHRSWLVKVGERVTTQ